MGEGLRNGFRPVGNARGLPGRGGKLAAPSRRERFSLLQLLCFIVFVVEARETVGGRACTGLSLRESEVRDPLIVRNTRVGTVSRMAWD